MNTSLDSNPHCFINGFRVFGVKSPGELLEMIQGKHLILIACNAEKVMLKEPRLQEIINKNLGYPDGMGIVFGMKRKGIPTGRIAGADFWLDIIRQFPSATRYFLIGSTEEVIEQTVTKLKADFPKISIAGYRDGFLKEEDEPELIRQIKESRADVVFVAQGSPRQEYLMERLILACPALYMGLGGSFDAYTGAVKRAPVVFQENGMEWFYRLVSQPRKRYKRDMKRIAFFFRYLTKKL